MSRTLAILPLCLAALLLAACSAPYVNVPPVPGDLAFHDPNGSDVRAMEVKALRYLLQKYPPAGEYAVVLPPGSTTDTHAFVIAQLPHAAAAAPPAAETPTLPTYRVAQIQARSWNCQVDIIAPERNGDERLVSIFLGKDIDGWFALQSRKWNVPVEQALQLARPLIDAPEESRTAPEPAARPAAPPGN